MAAKRMMTTRGRNQHLMCRRRGGSDFSWRFGIALIGAMLAVAMFCPTIARADYCCGCEWGSVSVSDDHVDPNEAVTITFTSRFCNCWDSAGCHTGDGYYCAALSTPATIYVELQGGGLVAQHTCGAFPGTADWLNTWPIPNNSFQFIPSVPGVYTTYSISPCGTSDPVQITVGCGNTCADIGTPDACDPCGSAAAFHPVITSNKNVIRTLCPTDCDVEEGDKGETVTVTITAGGSGTPDCYQLAVTTNGAVEIVDKPANSGAFPGTLRVQLRGLIGVGDATVECMLYKYDSANYCWSTSTLQTLNLEALPDDDCECPTCPVPGATVLATGGTIRAAPKLGSITLGDVELNIRAGNGDPLRIPAIVDVHDTGELEVLLPDRANSVIFLPGDGFLEGWILGGPPARDTVSPRGDYIQISHIPTALTYLFEAVEGEPYPYRLARIMRFDYSTQSSFVYDGAGLLIEIHVGFASSTTYFDLTYDASDNLEQITPVVEGTADNERAVVLVYEDQDVIGVDGAVCPMCSGERRRFYFSSKGLLETITNADGDVIEQFTYDDLGRLTVHEKLNDQDVLVVVKTVEYAGDYLRNSSVIVHEHVSDDEERIRVEYYDDNGRLEQTDQYEALFPHGSDPSGEALTTVYNRIVVDDPNQGMHTEISETINPFDVTSVSIVRTFEDQAPLFLAARGEDSGWRLPLEGDSNAFELQGFHATGDAPLTPQLVGATATTTFEVGADGVYHLFALLHDAATMDPNDTICIEAALTGGEGGFELGYAARSDIDPPPADWTGTYQSCAEFKQAGFEHAGWWLDEGVLYTLTITVAQMAPTSNPADGWGIDGLALTMDAEALPDDLPEAPHHSFEGSTRYVRSYTMGSEDGITGETLAFAEYNAITSSYQTIYLIDARGGVTEYSYDDYGNTTLVTAPEVTLLDGGGAVQAERVYEYDENSRQTRVGQSRTGGGYTYTDTQYDAYGAVAAEIRNAGGDPNDQATTAYGYSIYGEQTSVTLPCGEVSESIYGAAGKLVDEIVYAAGASGDLIAQTKYEYDADYRLIRKREAWHHGPFAMDAPDAWADTTFAYDLYGRVIQESKPGGLVTTFHYDYQDQLIEQTNPDTSYVEVVYDGVERLVSRTTAGAGVDPLTEWNLFDDYGLLMETIGTTGYSTEYGYDEFGRRTFVVAGGVQQTETTYDALGQAARSLVTEVDTGDPLADAVFDYDELGRMIMRRDRLDLGVDGDLDPVQLTVYDVEGRTIATIDKADGAADLTAYENGDRRVRNVYDALNRVTHSIDPADVVTEFTYDLCGRVLTKTLDPNGLNYTETYTYDAMGRTIQTTTPDGAKSVMDYDSLGHPVQQLVSDPNDVPIMQKRWIYDEAGRVTRSVKMADAASAAAPDTTVDAVIDNTYYADGVLGAGKLESRTAYDGAMPATATYTYDGIGRSLRAALPVDPAQNYAESEYDPSTGRQAARIENSPLGQRRIEYIYDGADRIITEREVGGGGEDDLVTQFAYDGLDREIVKIAPNLSERHRGYDLLGRLILETEDAGGLAKTATKTYDRLNRVVAVTANDGAGDQVTEFAYDPAGRRTLLRSSDHGLGGESGEFTYAYNAANKVTSIIDPRGVTTEFEYNSRGLATRKFVTAAGVDYTYTYDALGRMTGHRRDADNHVVRAFNDLGQLVSEVQTVAGVSKTIGYTRDTRGLVQSLTYPAETGLTLTYEYDALGMNTVINRGGTPLIEYQYAGRRITDRRLHTDQGVQVDMDVTYDHHGRVIGLANTSNGANLATFGFEHDSVGLPTENYGSSERAPTSDVNYSYDGLNRVTQADYKGSLFGSEVFEYDLHGSRTRYVPRDRDAGQPDQGVAYKHNLANEYTQITTDGVAVAIMYDAAGNLSSDERGYGYSYDFECRMTRVFADADADGEYDEGETIHAEYAYDAMGRRTQTLINGVTRRYFYDDHEDVLVEYDAADMNTPWRWYVHGTANVDERAVMYTNDPAVAGAPGADFYYLLGNLCSVAGLVSDRGAVVEAVQYDAYGKPTVYRPYGDTDYDGDVDWTDYGNWADCMSGPSGADDWVAPSLACTSWYDLDLDGDVDMVDFAVYQSIYTGPVEGGGYVPPSGESFNPAPLSDFNPYYFTGRRVDLPDAGSLTVQYNRARYYSLDHGRWHSRDPREFIDGYNLYEYVAGAPTILVDPSGMSMLDLVLSPLKSLANWAARQNVGFSYHNAYEWELGPKGVAGKVLKFIGAKLNLGLQYDFFTYDRCCINIAVTGSLTLAFQKEIGLYSIHPALIVLEPFLDLSINFTVTGFVGVKGTYCIDREPTWSVSAEFGVDVKLFFALETEAWIEWLGGKAYGQFGAGIKFSKTCSLPGGCGSWQFSWPYIFAKFGVKYKSFWGGWKSKEVEFQFSLETIFG